MIVVPKFEVKFIYDGSNGSEIAAAFPHSFIINEGGELVMYNAGFEVVEPGAYISGDGYIIAASKDEFEKRFTEIK